MRFAHAALLFFVAQLPARAAVAQAELGIAADGKSKPGGQAVATLLPGVRLAVGPPTGSETLVPFDGWVDASRLGPKKDSFPASVSGRLTLRVRAQPSSKGAIVATLAPGTGVATLGHQGTWTHVRRSVWIATSSLDRSTPAPTTKAPPPATKAVAPPATPASTGASAPAPATRGATGPLAGRNSTSIIGGAGAKLHDLPVGKPMAGLTPGSAVEVLSRQSGWVRVRADGWIQEKDLVSGGEAAPPNITAADLRADPAGSRGRIVQWDVEVMSLQMADPLRVELARDEPYLLARGPDTENAILYLAVPPTLMTEARGIAPLSKVRITAKVRSGRSEPAGAPILDLISIVRR